MSDTANLRPIAILGTGHYLPELTVTNDDFTRIVETSDEWIRTRTGIESRHMSDGEAAWQMGAHAARAALEDAQLEAEQIDVILVTTVTPDYATPSVSCIVQAEIGADNAFCMDLNVACSGFVYAFDLASRYLMDPSIGHVMIVATELLSRITDFSDRSTCVLFGDGAAAMVVGRGDGSRGILATHLGADGRQGGVLTAALPTRRHPFSECDIEPRFPEARETLGMSGREVFRFAVEVMSGSVARVLEDAGYDIDALDLLVPHQANNRILEAAAKRLGLPMSRIFAGLETIGNTSSVSIPLGIDLCRRAGRLEPGQLVAICGFGGGLTYGAVLFTI